MPAQPQSVPAMVTLRDQFNIKYPTRSVISDGWIGDKAHQSRFSYHNPDDNNWVHARDFTHHPIVGMDIDRLTDELAASGDPRILEMIANDLYWHRNKPRWVKYDGENEHRLHFHITARPGPWAMDTRPWMIPSLRDAVPPTQPPPGTGPRLLLLGTTGDDVKRLQDVLRRHYRSYAGHLVVDGAFGPQTELAVREFQRRSHLVPDGVVGPATRRALGL